MEHEEYRQIDKNALEIYNRAKKNNLTNIDRWEEGIEHHPKSLELMKFLEEHDLYDYDDYFCWKVGGDGDNGEFLMFEMDAYFEQKDKDESFPEL